MPSHHTPIAESDMVQALERIAALERRQDASDRELAELRALSNTTHGSLLSRADRALLGRLLPVIAGVLGSEWFLTRELLAADSPALALVLHGFSAKSLGRLFRRAVDSPVAGFVVRRAGTEGNATLWCIEQVVV